MEKAVKKYWPIFLLPTMAAFLIGFIIPFIEGIYLSFCNFTTIKDAKFVGIQNYIEAFKDSNFLGSFKFTTLFAIVSLVLINVLAFLVALALTQNIKGKNIFRTVFFMPNLIGGIVLGYVWQLIFDGIFVKFDTALKLNGTGYSCRLAADWLHDDRIHRGTSGDPRRYSGSGYDRRSYQNEEIV